MKPTRLKNTVSKHRLWYEFVTVSDLHSSVFFLAVKFHQHSVFPVHFSTETVKKWWGTDLSFKIYSRKSDQKKVSSFGVNITDLIWLKWVILVGAGDDLGLACCSLFPSVKQFTHCTVCCRASSWVSLSFYLCRAWKERVKHRRLDLSR